MFVLFLRALSPSLSPSVACLWHFRLFEFTTKKKDLLFFEIKKMKFVVCCLVVWQQRHATLFRFTDSFGSASRLSILARHRREIVFAFYDKQQHPAAYSDRCRIHIGCSILF